MLVTRHLGLCNKHIRKCEGQGKVYWVYRPRVRGRCM